MEKEVLELLDKRKRRGVYSRIEQLQEQLNTALKEIDPALLESIYLNTITEYRSLFDQAVVKLSELHQAKTTELINVSEQLVKIVERFEDWMTSKQANVVLEQQVLKKLLDKLR